MKEDKADIPNAKHRMYDSWLITWFRLVKICTYYLKPYWVYSLLDYIYDISRRYDSNKHIYTKVDPPFACVLCILQKYYSW